MDTELKQYLEAMESRINARTEAMESRMNGRADAMEDRINTNIAVRIEKSETNLLSAFYGWARSMEIRVRGVGGITTGFDERLALAEERISQLERKKAS
jgi:hypothetical protein